MTPNWRYHTEMDIEQRFWSKVDKTGDCWTWTAGCGNHGYGIFYPAKGRQALAHRWAYEQGVGPIPPGMVVDHECHNRSNCLGGKACPHRKCVNPSHLRVRTIGQNLAASPNANARKTHCPRGHEYTPENTYLGPPSAPGREPSRRCRECARERDRQPERVARSRDARRRRNGTPRSKWRVQARLRP